MFDKILFDSRNRVTKHLRRSVPQFSRLLCIIYSLIIPIIGKADYMGLILTSKNGDIQSFVLKSISNISFDNNDMIIISDKQIERYSLSDIKEYDFEYFPDSRIKSVLKNKEVPFKCDGMMLTFVKLPPNSIIRIFKLDGMELYNSQVQNDEITQIDCSKWSQGIYIVSINGETYKFAKS